MVCDTKHRAIHAAVVWFVLVGTAIGIAAVPSEAGETEREGRESSSPLFERDVVPILMAHCYKCHGLEARKADLDLRSVGLMLRGSENGPVIVKETPDDSPLYERIADGSMPPEGELRLTADEITVIRRWLEAGAPAEESSEPLEDSQALLVTDKDREFWAFQPPDRPAVPAVMSRDRLRTPIDALVLARLEGKSLEYSPDADRQTLVRRLYLDLIGLPPSPEDVNAFRRDDAPAAYERLVDRLLDSPSFGERWGRHWLDAVGYADTIGDDTDAAITKVAKGKWRFRDYVIRVFNDDVPYDRFLTEQFAGDESFDWRRADSFTPAQQNLLIATGFLRMAADETLQGELNTADIRHAILQETTETALNSVLALTIGCARCHSHKFDPIPQEDYYRLLSIFTPAFNPQSWLQPAARELPNVPPSRKKQIDEHNSKLNGMITDCQSQLNAIRQPYEDRLLSEKLAGLEEPDRSECRAALKAAPDQRTDRQKQLVAKFGEKLKVTTQEIAAALSEEMRVQVAVILDEMAKLGAKKQSWQTIQAVYDVGEPPASFLLRRGNHERPGQEVTPGLLRVLCRNESEASLIAAEPNEGTSGRRLALARWLTDRTSPAGGLVARVFVNRVWQQLFGQGIVTTSENFGSSGSSPTHPELLDWMAVEFMQNEWRVKPFLRLLVTSTVYRQVSTYPEAVRADSTAARAAVIDPENEMLWRMRLRPLEAETVRDSILTVSGALDRRPGGPPIIHEPDSNGLVRVKKESLTTPTSQWRRSVYLLCRRRYHLSLMETFDMPEVVGTCMRRTHAPVVAQSLTMLNDPFLTEQSQLFAARVAAEIATGRRTDQIKHAFEIGLGRPARDAEMRWSEELLEQQTVRYAGQSESTEDTKQRALQHLCSILLNTSEFLYIR